MRIGEPLSLGDIYQVGYELTRRQEARAEAREVFIERLKDNPPQKDETPTPVEAESKRKGQQVNLTV